MSRWLPHLDVPAIGYGIRYEFGIFDQAVRDSWQVAFNATNAHAIYPAANLTERFSAAGKKASGTGNMKFSLSSSKTHPPGPRCRCST